MRIFGSVGKGFRVKVQGCSGFRVWGFNSSLEQSLASDGGLTHVIPSSFQQGVLKRVLAKELSFKLL